MPFGGCPFWCGAGDRDHLSRLDLVILDELGDLPLALSGGQWLFHFMSRLYELNRAGFAGGCLIRVMR